MPYYIRSRRLPPPPGKASLKHIRALMLDHQDPTPYGVNVATIIPAKKEHSRFPCVESVLGTTSMIHDCWVSVTDCHDQTFVFLICAQTLPLLPVNQALRRYCPVKWKGSIVVMQGGEGGTGSVVNLRGDNHTKQLALQAVKKYATKMNAFLLERVAAGQSPTPHTLLPRGFP